MADLFDYLYWRGDMSTRCLPVNPVDGLILSWFSSMYHREPVADTVGRAAEAVSERAEGETTRLVQALSQSARFRGMRLMGFRRRFSEEEELQFGAMTVLTGDGWALVVYRGTDATLVGWKEDFNMAFADEVPAQREAAAYLEEMAQVIPLPLRVAGHSKGGNLAVYAAANAEPAVQRRIGAVWNFDGPGMNERVMQSPGYRSMETRIETYLPESSVVGILLERAGQVHVVESDAVGPMQHVPYSWRVTPSGFEEAEGLTPQSLYADRTIRTWLNSMSRPERQRLVDGLYDVVKATGARTLGEVSENWRESGLEMLGGFAGLDLHTKASLIRGIGGLIAAAAGQPD